MKNIDSISGLRQQILSGVVSSKEITLDILSKIEASDLNCFISLLDAEEQARLIDEKIKCGFTGRLAGVPIAIKDNMRYKGSVTTCGSKILSGIDCEDAEVVKRLKAEGAVIIGKTNMDEFAMGSSNTTSAFGPVKNPLNNSCVPGGSSGGSAAAVSAGLCYGALGSDTGGSIRQPASYCGVVGLKPTLGSIDGTGMYALSQDMDQIGPITNCVDDCKLLFEVLSGRKLGEPNCHGLKIGLISEFESWYDTDTYKVIERAKEVLSAVGCTFVTLSAPSVNAAFATYCVLGNAQSANNLRGIGNEGERTQKLGKEVKKRVLIGEYVLSHPEIIEKAKRVKSRIIRELGAALEQCDIIISPTAPSKAFEFSADRSRKEIVYSDIFTQPSSIAGLPALSVPCVNVGGMPIGVQIVGRKNAEDLLFALGKLFEA
ncbi:MAG: Asp-tRNA(Asn)/Glu-tRNA(Gln) amidotransferase subunit GatA [Clostridiales bacterium]|nr:Asp-tRNA(Asn)/Glu-tRNA(Gln) amidotransferase subunit GatA [Clostridiales bacterium]